MKLFVWDDDPAIEGYFHGLAFALGDDLEQARGCFKGSIAANLGEPSKIIDCDTRAESFGLFVRGGDQ